MTINHNPTIGPEINGIGYYVEKYHLTIMFFDTKKDVDKPVRVEHFNYSDPNHKNWLGKVTYWAMNEGYEMLTVRTDIWEKEYK